MAYHYLGNHVRDHPVQFWVVKSEEKQQREKQQRGKQQREKQQREKQQRRRHQKAARSTRDLVVVNTT